jgi:tetratricopeptide (TPR) repeat protein
LKQKAAMRRKAIIAPYQALYDAASSAFNAKKYNVATRYYTELLTKEPRFTEAHNYRAYCYYSIKEYTKSNLDLDFLISSGETRSNLYNLYNLRGVNYRYLGNINEACKNYKIAADMGDKDGLDNYAKLCQSQ